MASVVTVVGGGIFGLSCAWELVRRGSQVRVLEAGRVGDGSSGGTVGSLSPHAPENWNRKKAVQLDALIAAETWWADVARVGGGDPGYGRTGRIQPVGDAAQIPRLRERIAAAAQQWPARFSMALTSEADGPLVPDSPTGLWLTDTLTARINPRKCLSALVAAITASGCEVAENTGPLSPSALKDTPVIWATGVQGLLALSKDMGRPVGSAVKGQSALLSFDAPDVPQVFADGVHIVPHSDGTMAIGSTSERDVTDTETDDQLDDLIARARQICPVLGDAPVIDRWAGLRPRAASRAPLVGAWPGHPGHYVANGGFKIGFGMAPAVAGMIADLILEGQDRIPSEFGFPA